MARKRKTLLEESEIRRFMKLAKVTPLSDRRMNEMGYGPPGARDDEEIDIDAEMDLDGDGVEAIDAELEMPPEPDPAPPMDEPIDDVGDGGMMVSVDDFMSALEGALEEVTGEEVETEVDLAGDEEIEIDDAEDPEGGDMLGGPEAEPAPDAGLDMDIEVEDEEALQEKLVNRVAMRVARRLQEEKRKAMIAERVSKRVERRLVGRKKKERMTNELTERIFKRLTQK
tara:strand:+ start:1032 stop:1712 length:681 start_codon:yes stop_codon:yes gene_type:complete